ncbi:amino acid adenylation domain-containing protein [Scytonema sp. UIC 10036]|uniref:non-ribosomal peptide synthetase n=1 Tax=Scytonema sp. UIC 10036 TaxID=2304196 RepID=UPI0012DAC012|nr:non-ribosomal peptide synthetase [Scytonema sp. UIC 10036]MUG92221.1 amino acid adenylation domain-containing protein [Scytonema sp. UIC 10036]
MPNDTLYIGTIPKRTETSPCQLSFAQARLWFLSQLEPNSPFYNAQTALRLKGSLNITALAQSFNEIVRRHEVLRTTFVTINGQAAQVIAPTLNLPLPVVNLQDLSELEREAEVLRLATEEEQRSFNLAEGPLLQTTLLQLGQTEYVLLFTIHHIVSDGWSVEVLIREIVTLYKAFCSGKPSPLSDLPIQYADFAIWQRQWLQGVLAAQLAYWQQQLSGSPSVLQLPTDCPRPAIQSFRGAAQSLSLPIHLTQALKALSRQERVTLFMTLLAAFKTLLYRYTNQDDILVGAPIANRNQAEIEGLIGFFVNTLVLRTYLGDNPSFRELLGRVRKVALEAYAHQDLPFELLVEALQPERDLSRNPLFQVMFNMLNFAEVQIELPGLTVEPLSSSEEFASKFDLSLYASQKNETIQLKLVYNSRLFEQAQIVEMLGHFSTLLESIIANPEQPIATLPLLTEAERYQRSTRCNLIRLTQPFVEFNFEEIELSICARFEQQVKKYPKNIAVKTKKYEWTYEELNSAANQVAQTVFSITGNGSERVALLFEHDAPGIAAILGILKAGKTYVPLDPSYPQERLAYILADSQASVILTNNVNLALAQALNQDTLYLINIDEVVVNASGDTNLAMADTVAYILYTSGSTGQPKGVFQNHRNVLHHIRTYVNNLHISSQDKLTLFSSYSFDAAVMDIFGALLSGATLYPINIKEEGMVNLSEWLIQQGITIYHSTPSVYRYFVNTLTLKDKFPKLRLVVLGGEEVFKQDIELYKKYFDSECILVNGLGPTESTLSLQYFLNQQTEITRNLVPVGYPVNDTEILLLNQAGEQVAVYGIGEIAIACPYLALGYWRKPEMTQAVFLNDSQRSNRRIYCSGDLGRLLPDGSIEFVGRKDFQVKIRGYRIELSEIQTQLLEIPEVKEAVVVARGEVAGDKRLVAYVVPNQESIPTISELRHFLKQKLPEYMVPSAFVFLDALPVTPNGKVDQRLLPAPQLRTELTQTFVSPQTLIQEMLALIWADVLRVEQLGIYDNFFELGGHSLLATQIISQIRATFAVELPLRSLFEEPTVAGLAECIETDLKLEQAMLTPPVLTIARRDGDLPLSFAQQRLWFLEQLEPGSAVYNIPVAVQLSGQIDQAALERSLNAIISRHEALRTNFITVEEQPIAVIAETRSLMLPVMDLRTLPESEKEFSAQRLATQEAVRPFDLATDLLVRAKLLQLAEAEHVLLLTMHHIVSDGWSMGVLVRELATLYSTFCTGHSSTLPELPIQYADFAVWQRQWLQGEVLKSQLAYWKQQLDGAPTFLELPGDRPRPAVQTFRGAHQSLVLSKELSKAIASLSQREGVTLFMTLLAVFGTLLYRYTGQSDILVGTPIANRNHSQIEGLIGFFVNTLVLRTNMSGNPSFRELLSRVREVALGAYAHQDLPFELLVEELQPTRDLSRNPLFQVMFNLLNFAEERIELPGLTVKNLSAPEELASKFDLTLYAVKQNEIIHLKLVYNTDLFEQAQIVEMLGHFSTLLENIIANPEQSITTLPLLTEAERYQRSTRCNLIRLTQPFIEFNFEEIELSICARFEQQVKKYPKNIAVKTKKYEWTYEELNAAANQVAQTVLSITGSGIERVALLFEHDAPAIAAILGILKAGKTYVPLDPSYPQERLAYMLADSQASIILTNNVNLTLAQALNQDTFYLINIDEVVVNASGDTNLAMADTVAYILYTSGSTGQPKGVFQNHRNVLHHIRTYVNNLHISSQDKLTLFSSYSFDAAVMDIFGALLSGATLYPINIKEEGMVNLSEWLIQQGITIYHSTPSVYRYFVNTLTLKDKFPKLRLVVLGGEEVFKQDIELYKKYFDSECILVNGLGPTESTLSLQYFLNQQTEITRNLVPVGYPVNDTEILLLNQAGEQVAVYGIGEIAIACPYLALGYWQKPEMTQAVFLNDPQRSNRRIYCSGDLGRLLPDGSIEFVGRKDFQVKIRGYRIELSEIQTRLLEIPGVKEAVVVARGEVAGDKRLVAYVVPNQESIPTISELRHFLKQKLPEYMVPSAFVFLDALPVTPNGKVDQRLLPAPDISQRSLEVNCVPRTPTEKSLAAIWAKGLGLEQVGIYDNFFELGGHSLLAIQVIAQLRSTFCVELPLRCLFEFPTVAELAEHIEKNQQGDEASVVPLPVIVPAPEQRYYPFPLTDIQQAYWVGRSEAFELGNVATHSYFEIESHDLNLERLNLVWQKLIERHDMLRAVVLPDGQQQILSLVPPYQIEVLDLRGQDDEAVNAKLSSIRQQMSHQVLPTDKWPLFEIRATRLDEQRLRLHISFDALLADAWSKRCLVKEWVQLYQNLDLSLPPLELSFRDYVLTEQRLQATELYQRSQDYWFSRLDTLPPAPELPLVKHPGSLKQPQFQRRSGHLDRELWQQLQQRSTKANLTASGILLAAFAEILTVWSKNPQFTINLTLFNRLPLHPQVNDIVGDFTSLTLLAIDNSASEAFTTRARRIQQQMWQDLDHRYFSGVRVLRELVCRQGGTQRALMPVVFTSTLGLSTVSEAAGVNRFGDVVYGISQTPQVWLDHQVTEQDGGLVFNWDAVEDLFPEGLLDDMFDAYNRFLKQLATEESVWLEPTRQLVPPNQLNQRSAINTKAAPISQQMLHTLFAAQIEVRANECALISPNRTLTYLELSALVNQVGRRLRQLGATPNQLVAVVMEKGWEQVVAVLGVLMSGAAYLPIDPELPTQRRWHLLKQGEVKLVLTLVKLKENLEWPSNIQLLCLNNKELVTVDNSPLESVQSPEDLAYVIYTSGSTGLPKGVTIDHRGAVNTILDINQRFDVGPQDRVLALSALSFDLSVYDIFGTLAAGGTIVVPEMEGTKDPARWAELMAQHQVTLWNSVPAFMQMLVEYVVSSPEKVPPSLRLALLSGDWLPVSLPDQMKALWPTIQVVSLGGATEASIWSILYPIETVDPAWKSIPYGKPLRNQRFYVLNEALNPCPVWVPGELYIGGVGLAKGYWQNQDKTRVSFLTHPRTKERLYRTGDLGRYLPDGNIEFLGREDFQVKLQGHRIELGEIESVLAQHPAVRSAVVVAVGKSANNRRLVAYLVCDQDLASNKVAEGDVPFQQLDGVLIDRYQRLEFKLKKPGLRADLSNQPFTQLIKPKLDESLRETYTQRRSHRRFVQEPIGFEQFSQFLSCLVQLKLDSAVLPKYRYGSASGLYPVQIYLYIKPERVEGLAGGTYYYHPQQHRLILLSAGAKINGNIHGLTNRTTFDESAFSLFLIAQLNAITPMYGNKARDFCLIEAGLISQLLETSAPNYKIGLCQIGGFDFERVRHLFALDESHEYLYSLLGGRAQETKNKMFLENPSPVLSSEKLQYSQSQGSSNLSAELKIYLKEKLPEYMVPSAFVLLDALPLTHNGKVDRKALPEPEEIVVQSEVVYVEPQNEVERIIAAVWQEVLQIDKVGVHDNFFDLGGNSVHIVRIHRKLQEIFHNKIAVVKLFEYPTIRSLVSVLSSGLPH